MSAHAYGFIDFFILVSCSFIVGGTRTFASLKNGASLFLKASLSRAEFGLFAPCGLKFSSLEMSYQRFPPLDHGPEVNPVFI